MEKALKPKTLDEMLEHKSTFRTVEAVAVEKQKLVEALPAKGLAILNYDDPRVAAMAGRTKAREVTFGQKGGDYVTSSIQCLAPRELVELPNRARSSISPQS